MTAVCRWCSCRGTSRSTSRCRFRSGRRSWTAAWRRSRRAYRSCSTRRTVLDALDELVDSLLYEGYALYPYTPGATKNATPTPFGIVYPPVYAETLASTFDHLELRCVLRAPPDAVLSAEVRFLVAGGERHKAAARLVDLSGAAVGAPARVPAPQEPRNQPEIR